MINYRIASALETDLRLFLVFLTIKVSLDKHGEAQEKRTVVTRYMLCCV